MAKAPAAAAMAAPAAASVAKLAMPSALMNPMAMVSRMPPAASSIAKIPLGPIMDKGVDDIIKKMQPSWFEKNRGNIRDMGLGLMQMGLQQQQAQASPMQLSPFQPTLGGGGGAPPGTPQLVALAQQLGLNKVL